MEIILLASTLGADFWSPSYPLLHDLLTSTWSIYSMDFWPDRCSLTAWSFDFRIVHLLHGVLTWSVLPHCMDFWLPRYPPSCMDFWPDQYSLTAWSFDFLIIHLLHGVLTWSVLTHCMEFWLEGGELRSWRQQEGNFLRSDKLMKFCANCCGLCR